MSPPLGLIAYLIVAGALLWLAHRYLNALRRVEVIVLLLLPLTFTGKALLLGRVYAPVDLAFVTQPLKSIAAEVGVEKARNGVLSDVYSQVIPWHASVRSAIRQGEWPLWNPYMFAGDILAAAATPAPYWPFNLISVLLPFSHALTFLAAITFFIAGLSVFLFMREQGCGTKGSLFAAAAWTLCEFFAFWVEWPLGVTATLLPLVLLATQRAVKTPDLRAAVLLTICFVLILLAGHPESALHIVFLAGLYALFLLVHYRKLWLRFAVVAFVSGLTSLLLCALFILPIVEALPQTHEYEVRSRVAREGRARPSWSVSGRMMRINLIPFVHGLPEFEMSDEPWQEVLPGAYAGSIAIPLALLGLIRSRSPVRWPMLAFLVLGVLTGGHAPWAMTAIEPLPLFEIAHNERLILAAVVALPVLAGLGIEELERDRRTATILCLVTLAILAVAVGLAWRSMRSELTVDFLRHRTLLLLVPLSIVTFTVALVGKSRVAWFLLVLLLLQRWFEAAGRYPTLPQQAFYPITEELEAIPRGGVQRMTSVSFSFVPNISAVYGLEDVRGYQAMTHLRWFQTYPAWCVHQPVYYNRVDNLTKPFISFLNVRYALLDNAFEVPPGWHIVRQTETMKVIENLNVLERAFVPRRVRLGPIRPELLDQETDFGRRSWIAAWKRGQHFPVEIDNGPGMTEVEREGLGLRISANMEKAGWMVISQTAWKGWRAYLDGSRVPLFIANYAFLAVQVPAGQHYLQLHYRPDSFSLGLRISVVTAVILIAFGLWRWKRTGVTRSSALT